MPNGGNKQQRGSKSSVSKYRFEVGERVLCRTGHGWESGKIVKLDYVNPGDPTVHPYQVSINGRLIYVPWDEDTCCKRHVVTWWEDLMQREDLTDEEGCSALKRLSRGKDVNAKDHEGNSAAHVALDYNWAAGVKQLLELRADPNLAGERHSRLLNTAVRRRNVPLITLLLEARADPSLQDEDPDKDPNYESKSFQERELHRSALHYASELSLELTEMLLERSADINQTDSQLKQPLHLAIEANMPEVVDLLLDKRADVDTGNQTLGLRSTPLIDAAYRKDIDLVRKLIVARSDVNWQGKQGMTPLHMAVRGRNAETVRLLMESKADVNIKVMGQTAAQLARTNNQNMLACILDPDSAADESSGDKQVQAGKAELDSEMRKLLFLD